MKLYFKNDFTGLAAACAENNVRAKRVMIVGDTNTLPLYGESAAGALSEVFEEVFQFAFTAGEEHKNLASIEELYTALLQNHFDRKDVIFALGGGVVGDMAGFAAATYLRGIKVIQCPTTLLAQVDSSIGGKTGVDYMGYKNMVGAFHMPVFVYMNTRTLETLPEDQFASGMGEVLKSAILGDADFMDWLLQNSEAIKAKDPETILSMVERTAGIKEAIVLRDPTEQGERALLNLGHTIGHAIEKYKDFTMAHGLCVAVGTVAAAAISAARGILPEEEFMRVRDANRMFGLPVQADEIDEETILTITKSDKKMAAGRIRFILFDRIGHAFIADDVTDEELLAGIKSVNGVRA